MSAMGQSDLGQWPSAQGPEIVSTTGHSLRRAILDKYLDRTRIWPEAIANARRAVC